MAALERHYTVGEVAKLWQLSTETIRTLFRNRAGEHLALWKNIPGYRDHHSGHHDHCSVDRGQLIGDHPGTSDRHHPGIMIGIIPEPLIGMSRNNDRHRPESAKSPKMSRTEILGGGVGAHDLSRQNCPRNF